MSREGIPASRLLLLDLDDTLISRRDAFGRWAADLLRRHGVLSEPNLALMREADGEGLQHTAEMAARVLERIPLSVSVDDLVTDYETQIPGCFTPATPVVRSLLDQVRAAGWFRGLLTNGAQVQIEKARATGLLPHLDDWYVTELHRTWKPEPAAFTGAAALFGRPLDGAWMVGDGIPSDMAGAHGVGISSVWVSWDRPWPPSQPFTPTRTAPTGEAALREILTLG